MNNDWREYSYYNLDYLAHHGIKGQRWGVRRYQNPDGTLTAAGRKKYGSDDSYEVHQLKKKRVKDLSNEELRKIAERKQLEKAVKPGDAETKRLLTEQGVKLLTTAAVVATVAVGSKYIADKMPGFAENLGTAIGKSAVNFTKGATTEVAKGVTKGAAEAAKAATSVAKEVASGVAKAAQETGERAASTEAAKSYVEAVDNLIGKETGKAFVKAVDGLIGKFGGAAAKTNTKKRKR